MDVELAPAVRHTLMERWEPLYRSRLHYLVTWSTHGRRPVLKERHLEALRALIRSACEERDVPLVHVECGSDHVHVLFGLRPAQSVASAVRELKGRAGVELLARFPELRVWLRGNLVWDERYAVETVSPLRVERVRERLALSHRALPGPHDPEPWAVAS
ncbi:MAG TPA: IS200/IS605 family transposase [Candidatus Eisenbacteria bacterium]|nr:IS200/IS605 family transposase [Candidatus Eisenbacteria bacterium]